MEKVEYKGKVFRVVDNKLIFNFTGILDIEEIKGLDKLVNLEELVIYMSKITEIKGLENLENLKLLSLAGNQITEIKGLETLINLRTLILRSNQISEIKGLDNLSELEILNLRTNQISKIEGLENLSNLKKLSLKENKISEITGLEKLTNLEELILDENDITNINGLEALKSLKSLSIESNLIKEIKGLDSLINLSDLVLTGNEITEIKGLNKLKNLKDLYLAYNQITEMKGLERLENLRYIILDENPINYEGSEMMNPQELVQFCKLKRRKLFIFVIMPFTHRLTEIYNAYIKTCLTEKGFEVKRGDDFYKPIPVYEDIKTSIEKADVIIAELTHQNPNVFYEIGFAHAKDKYVILISQDPEDIPFNLRHFRTMLYEDSPEGLKQLQFQILNSVEEYLAKE